MRFSAFIVAALCGSSSLFANLNPTPVDVNATFDQVNKSDMHRRHKHDKYNKQFHYNERRALAMYNYAFDADNIVRAGIGVKSFMMKFEGVHPRVRETEFNNLVFNLAGETANSIYQDFKLQTDIYIHANTKRINLRNTFVLYDVEGVYRSNEYGNIHLGVTGTTGLHFTRLLPVLGFDYQKNAWKLNVVFPTNISTSYAFTKEWSVDAGVRWFISRQRLSKDETKQLQDGIVTYLNGGFELGLNYAIFNHRLLANIHAGETFGGRARIGDVDNHSRQTYRVKPAPYFGASLDFYF